MKKILFILTLLILPLQFVLTQEFNLGIQGGILFSRVGDNLEAYSGTGFTSGLSLEIPLNLQWAIRPEVNYQRRKLLVIDDYTSSGSNFIYESSAELRLFHSYIDIPVLMQYKSNNRFGFYFGPQFGALLASKYVEDLLATETNTTTGEKDVFRRHTVTRESSSRLNEISFALGPMYSFDFGLSIEGRFQRSVFLFNSDDIDFTVNWMQFQITARYNLPMSRKIEGE